MTNYVDYYFGSKPHDRTIERKQKACFSDCFHSNGIVGEYITYTLMKKEKSEVTREQIYKYLLFLRKIPEFRPWLREPAKLAEKREICFSCEEKNIGVFLAFTLFRAIDEFPKLIKEIASLKKKNYSLSNLGILRLHSNYSLITNNNHWLMGSLGNCTKEKLEKPVNIAVLESSRPLKKGFERKLFDFMDYNSFKEMSEDKGRNRETTHLLAYQEWKRENNVK